MEESEKSENKKGKKERKAGATPECLSEHVIHIQAEDSRARLAHRTRRSRGYKLVWREITANTAARVNIYFSLSVTRLASSFTHIQHL